MTTELTASEPRKTAPVILSYGVAVLSVTAALIIARFVHIHFVPATGLLFLCALMFSAWYGGTKPGLLAMALSLLAFKYDSVTPIHSWTVEEIPRLLIFALASVFVVSLSAAQRSAAVSLRRARDVLGGTVQQLKRTNEALQAENAERKRAEETLNAHALRYKTLLETSTDSIYVLNEKGDLQQANAAFLRRRGYSAGEVNGLNVADWDAQWSREQLQEKLRKLVGSSAIFETRHRCKDGSVFDVEVCATSVRIGGEQLFFAVTRDITERKQAEQALRESEVRFRRLLASNIIGVVFWTLQGDILEANDLFLNMVGYTREDLRQRRVNWKDLTPPEYAPVDEKAIGDLMTTGTCSPFEKEYVRKDGSRVSVLIGSALLEPHKEAGSSFVMDISERKQAEDRLRRSEEKFKVLFGIAPVGISVLDRQHNVADANPALEQITRLTKEELLNGTWRLRTYLNADGTPKPANELPSKRAVTENRPLNDIETGIVTENGEIIWTQVSVAPLTLPDASAVVITQDITERKRAEKTLKTSYDQLRAVSARLQSVREEEATRIAREIHDELGQKLTGLKMDLRRAERKLDELESSPTVNTVLDTIVSAAELADGIIATVQEIAANLRPGVLDKLGLGAALQYEGRRFKERTGIHCTVRLPEMESILSNELSTALFRIFQECLTNVTRHAHASEVEAELKLEPGSVILSVHDNGRGITPTAMMSSDSLGLLGMKERVALLGGEILFERRPEGGTIVTVRIVQSGVTAQSYEPV